MKCLKCRAEMQVELKCGVGPAEIRLDAHSCLVCKATYIFIDQQGTAETIVYCMWEWPNGKKD